MPAAEALSLHYLHGSCESLVEHSPLDMRVGSCDGGLVNGGSGKCVETCGDDMVLDSVKGKCVACGEAGQPFCADGAPSSAVLYASCSFINIVQPALEIASA